MLLTIYVKVELYSHVSEVRSESVGVGILGMMVRKAIMYLYFYLTNLKGNKGAVGIRLKLQDSWFCFVNSHLAASSSQFARRNQDFNEICKRLYFEFPSVKMEPWWIQSEELIPSSIARNNTSSYGVKMSLFDHELVLCAVMPNNFN
jgi:phosphatidylinositol-bisphosphatase